MKGVKTKISHRIWGAFLLVAGLIAASLCTPYPVQLVHALREKPQPEVRIIEKRVEVPVEVRVETPIQPTKSDSESTVLQAAEPWKPESLAPTIKLELPPYPPVLPEKLSLGTFEQFTALSKNLHLRSSVNFAPGTTAGQDRKNRSAYQIRISVDLLVPHAANGQELLLVNPELTKVLPRYHELMENARVSRWFQALYRHKQNQVRRAIASLSPPLDRHNYYDTDTILEIIAPGTRRHVLWIQADMDVVSDGSDGDRLPTMPESIRKSDHYQPTTSYRWKKRSSTPNPLLPGWEARLAKLQKEKPRRSAAIDDVKRIIWDIKRYSYLLAQYDPFIVVPLTLKEGREDAFRPQPGDYAVVIVERKAYPAIVGDFGPRNKAGEASLRLGKLINSKASVYARPVSSLGASYIIFPHSKEAENGPIDYDRLNTRCRELLDEMGGLGKTAEFVEIADLLAPKPTSEKAQESSPTAMEDAKTSSPTATQATDSSPDTAQSTDSESPRTEPTSGKSTKHPPSSAASPPSDKHSNNTPKRP